MPGGASRGSARMPGLRRLADQEPPSGQSCVEHRARHRPIPLCFVSIFPNGVYKKVIVVPFVLSSGHHVPREWPATGRRAGVLEEVSLHLMEGEASGPHVLGSVLGGSPWNPLWVVSLLGGVQRGESVCRCKQCSYGFGVGALRDHVGVWAVECLRNVASGGRSACWRLLVMPPHCDVSGAHPFPLSAWRV